MKYLLRSLPGVADLEARLQRIESHPNPDWAPEIDGLDEHIDQVSMRLFGTTEEVVGTFEVEDDGSPWREPLKELGWDVDDETGQPLLAFRYLVTPILCAIEGVAGRLPDAPASAAEIEKRAEDWGNQLAAAVERFRKERRRG